MHLIGSCEIIPCSTETQRSASVPLSKAALCCTLGFDEFKFHTGKKKLSDNKNGNSEEKAHSDASKKVKCQRGATGSGCGRAVQGH